MVVISGTHRLFIFVAILLWTASLAAAAPEADGPYVRPTDSDGWSVRWIEQVADGAQVRSGPLAIGDDLLVPAVGDLPAFKVKVRAPGVITPDELDIGSDVPFFAVADTHGEYDILVELLRNQGVIDQHMQWSFGAGQLAILGDVFDRGAHQTEILWLIYKLEAEAEAAGGGVHLLLGNHEALVLRGDERYLHPKYPRTAELLGVTAYADLFGPDTVLGQWLRTRATVMRYNDLLLVHGGISPGVVQRGLTLEQLNQAVRDVLAGNADPEESELHDFVMRSQGPLWYRGYFELDGQPPSSSAADVDEVLRHFGVSRVLVGHTALPEVTPLFDGKVVAVQVYPKRDTETGTAVIGAVVLEGGQWLRARVDGSRLPLDVAVE